MLTVLATSFSNVTKNRKMTMTISLNVSLYENSSDSLWTPIGSPSGDASRRKRHPTRPFSRAKRKAPPRGRGGVASPIAKRSPHPDTFRSEEGRADRATSQSERVGNETRGTFPVRDCDHDRSLKSRTLLGRNTDRRPMAIYHPRTHHAYFN